MTSSLLNLYSYQVDIKVAPGSHADEESGAFECILEYMSNCGCCLTAYFESEIQNELDAS